MEFSISIPQYVGDRGFDADGFRAHLRRAEELGFTGAWVQEQTFGTARTLSPLETMTYAAACSERLRLGCAVFVSPLHNPVHLAKAIATIDQLSHGRVEIGVGTGGRGRPYAAFGIDPGAMVARFNEGIAVMKACWADAEINLDGRFWKLEGAHMEPKPVQQPHPPLWIGGNHPDALRRAARLADGFFGAGSMPTAKFVDQVKAVREALAELGRDAAKFGFAKRLYVHVDDDAERAAARMEAALARHYERGGWSHVWVVGPPATCAAGIREVVDAGAEMILLNPLVDDAEQMERLAADVIPAV